VEDQIGLSMQHRSILFSEDFHAKQLGSHTNYRNGALIVYLRATMIFSHHLLVLKMNEFFYTAFSMHPNKSPGPYDLNPAFIKK